MSDVYYSKIVITPCFRLSFANKLITPETKTGRDGEYQVWSGVMLFPKTEDLSVLQNAHNEVVAQMYGNDPNRWPNFRNEVFRDGDTDQTYLKKPETYGAFRGHIAVKISCSEKPGFVYGDGKTEIHNLKDIYSGMWARAMVCAQSYDFDNNIGVRFKLYNLQKWKDDERIGGFQAPLAENAFGALHGSSAPTPGPSGFTPTPPTGAPVHPPTGAPVHPPTGAPQSASDFVPAPPVPEGGGYNNFG